MQLNATFICQVFQRADLFQREIGISLEEMALLF